MLRKKTEEISIYSNLWDAVFGGLKGVGFIKARAKKSLEKYKRGLQGWLVKTAVMGLSVFLSLGFLILGLSYMAIDYGGIPRGFVFVCGGFLGLLVLGLV